MFPQTANAPEWAREFGNVAAEFTNPGYFVSPEWIVNVGSRIGSGVQTVGRAITETPAY